MPVLVVLGPNDARVDRPGRGGIHLCLPDNTRIIALAGLITAFGFLFHGRLEYLSNKAGAVSRTCSSRAVYTGIAISSRWQCWFFLLVSERTSPGEPGMDHLTAIVIIAAFNYDLSVAKSLNFRKRFTEKTLPTAWSGIQVIPYWCGLRRGRIEV